MKKTGVQEACQRLLALEVYPETEYCPVPEAYKRVMAGRLTAALAVPSFPKSAYDGYALRCADTAGASKENPVTLKVTETIPAGSVGQYPITAGYAARIMTGAAIPEGADAVVKYEDTRFSESEVTLFAPAHRANIVAVGEDVAMGTCLMEPGKIICAADAAMMSGQGMEKVLVYKKPRIAIISTGSELLSYDQLPTAGKIYNTNPCLLGGYIKKYGMIPEDWGIVPDDRGLLADAVGKALEKCDMVITTGGVSAGDFDYMPKVMEQIGAHLLFHGVRFKPGGAMLSAVKGRKVILGLSGNPGAAAVGMLRIGLPYMKKLCGWEKTDFEEAEAVLESPFNNISPYTRFLRGTAKIHGGRLVFSLIENQKNGSVSSMMDCNLLGEVPPGKTTLSAGDLLKVYFV